MWLHYCIFGFLLVTFWGSRLLKSIDKNYRFFTIASFLMFFVLAAFRDVSVGNDTAEYYRIFELVGQQNTLFQAFSVTRYEIGYITLNYIITRFTSNFSVLLAVIAFVYLASAAWFIKRYSISQEMSVLMFFTMSTYYLIMNVERQCLAMAIFMLAIPFLEKKKYFKYTLLILLAATFHKSVLLFISMCFMPKLNLTNLRQVMKWLILSCAVLIALALSIQGILSYFPYYQHYFTESMYSSGGIRSASLAFFGIRIVLVFLVLITGKFNYQKGIKDRKVQILNQMMFLDCLIAAASIGFNMFDRIEKYLCLGFAISLMNGIETMKDQRNKLILECFTVGITFLYLTVTLIFRSEWSGIFPYSFISG